MASEAIGLDDIMATLMTMGFDYKDCQDAITNGKLTVQAAVDWILSGKPGNFTSDQPTLKLNQNHPPQTHGSSNPFIDRSVSSLTDVNAASSSSSFASTQSMDVDSVEDNVVSRSHLSDKQLQIKQNFEEKERMAARKMAQDEKKKQKLEKERILKEIQADREKQKLTKQNKMEDSVSTEKPATQTSTSTSVKKEEKKNDSALIQVRLPSGEMFRQTFMASQTLTDVWDAVYNRIKQAMNAHQGFIQPFPRREFSKEEMSHSLTSLGLTPSGSLVLKKKEVVQASVNPPNDVNMESADNEDDDEEEEAENDNLMDIPPMHRRGFPGEPRAHGHNWGRGFRVDEDNQPNDAIDFAEAAQAIRHNPFGEDGQMFEDGGEEGNPEFEGFGLRLVPEGVPMDDGHHLQRRAGAMAAEAAAQRFAQAVPLPEPVPCKSHSELKYNAHSLQEISMWALARRITDPRTPLFSMAGLSNDLLQAFLTYMKKERLLNPKVLLLMPSNLLNLNLDFYPYTTNELLHTARVLVNLKCVSMNSCTLITDAGLSCLKGMKVLKALSLQNCGQITDLCFSPLSELASLQSVNLEGTKVTNAGFSQFANSESCPQLTHINLGRTSVTHNIIPTLAKFRHLKTLCLKQNRICSLSGIESIPGLESLDVSETDIVSDSVLCLTRLPQLKHLCLTGTQELMGDTALSYMAEMKLMSIALPCRMSTTDIGMTYITGFTLTALDLTNYTNVGDAAMLSVGQITSLKTLLLTNTRITNGGMLQLTGLTNLEVLFVDKTFVGNEGVTVVQNFKMLTELSLAATSISSDLLKQGVLNKCTSLSKLNLSRTTIGDKGLQCLKLPHLLLLNLDCTRAHEYVEGTLRGNCPNIKHVTFANLSTEPEDEEG